MERKDVLIIISSLLLSWSLWMVVWWAIPSTPQAQQPQQVQYTSTYVPKPTEAIDPMVVFELINDRRADHGVAPLEIDDRLCPYAVRRSIEIKKDWSHNGFRPVTKDMKKEVYDFRLASFGENLASFWFDNKELVQAWYDSPTHQENMLDERFTHTCIECVGHYCTQLFIDY